MKLAIPKMLPDTEVTAISLEFGTVPLMQAFKTIRSENWLHHHGGKKHPRARELKTCMLRAFHPDAEEWEAAVWKQGKQAINLALVNLSQ